MPKPVQPSVLHTRTATFLHIVGYHFVFRDETLEYHYICPPQVDQKIRDKLIAGDRVKLEYRREPGRALWWVL